MSLADEATFLIGEFRRVYDDRYRIALPPELIDPLVGASTDAVVAKERDGCLSLWKPETWKAKFEGGVSLIQMKAKLDKLDLASLQRFSRMLSTRSRPITLGARGRLLVPEGFREFLAVEPNSEVIVVGAGLCIEIWNPQVWHAYLREDIGQFHTLFKELSS